jgi:uncharacterized protein with NRDE domain
VCTLIVARDVFRYYPLVVAANRDERLDRPSRPPEIWPGPIPILAPVDEEGGGTFIGVSRAGVLAAVTNRDDVPFVLGRPTRGSLVLSALESPSALESTIRIMESGGSFNGFNLVIADREEAFLIRGGPDGMSWEELPVGPTVVTNQAVGTEEFGTRNYRIGIRWRMAAKAPPRPSSLGQLLDRCDHEDGSYGTCMHRPPSANYGTRSSAIIRLNADKDGNRFEYWHREGRPCEGRFPKDPIRLEIQK